jgi:hypothetical protein
MHISSGLELKEVGTVYQSKQAQKELGISKKFEA